MFLVFQRTLKWQLYRHHHLRLWQLTRYNIASTSEERTTLFVSFGAFRAIFVTLSFDLLILKWHPEACYVERVYRIRIVDRVMSSGIIHRHTTLMVTLTFDLLKVQVLGLWYFLL